MTIDGATLSVGFGVVGAEGVIAATEGVASAFSAAVTQGVAVYEQTELLRKSLSALYSQELMTLDSTISLGQARKQAAQESIALTEMISRMAIQSPYSAQPLAQASQQALSYGLLASAIQDVTAARDQDAITVQRLVASTTDFSAATAGSADNVVELTSLLSKMYSSGTLYTEDLWQLQDRSVPALRILSEFYGTTTQGLRDMLSAGQVDAKEAVEAILDFIEEYYAGAAREASTTIAGIRASLSDLQSYASRDILTPAIETARPYLLDLVERLQTPGAEQFKMKLGLEMAEGFDRAVDLFGDVTDSAQRLEPALDGLIAVGKAWGVVLSANAGAMAVSATQAAALWLKMHPGHAMMMAQAAAIWGVSTAWSHYKQQISDVSDAVLESHEWWTDSTATLQDAETAQTRVALEVRKGERELRLQEKAIADLKTQLAEATPGTQEYIDIQRELNDATSEYTELLAIVSQLQGFKGREEDAQAALKRAHDEIKSVNDQITELQNLDQDWLGQALLDVGNAVTVGFGGTPAPEELSQSWVPEELERLYQLREEIQGLIPVYDEVLGNVLAEQDAFFEELLGGGGGGSGELPTDPATLSESALKASDAIAAAYRERAEAIYDAEVTAAQAREDLETETTEKIEEIQQAHRDALLDTQRTYVDAALEQWRSYNEQFVASDEAANQRRLQAEIAHLNALMQQGGSYDEIVAMHDEWKEQQLQNEINRNAELQQNQDVLHGRVAEAEAEHAETLAEIDQDYHDEVTSETERFNDELAELAQERLDALTEAADAAYDAAQEQYTSSLDAGVSFIQAHRDALEEWNEKRETMAKQGAWCAIPEEEEAFAEQEAQRAAAYARQEDELRDHLGRELIEYVRANALKEGLSIEAMNRMTQGIAEAYGVQLTPAETMFAQDMAALDQIIASGGQGMDAWLAGADRRHEQAISQSLERERRIDAEAEKLARLHISGAISQGEYLARLADVPTRVDTELGLTPQAPDASAAMDAQRQYESDVETAQADHQQTLADLEADWQAQRRDAHVAHEEAVATIIDEYQREREAAMAAHQTALLQIELARVQGVYDAWLTEIQAWEDLAEYRADQLDAIQTQYDAEVQAAELAAERKITAELAALETISEAREALANAAPGTFEADAWVDYYRNTQAIMERDLSIEQRQLLLDQERKKLREQLDQLEQDRIEAEQRLVIPSDHPTSPVQILPPERPPRQPITIGHPAEEPIVHSPTRTPTPPPPYAQESDYWSGGGYRRDIGGTGTYTAQGMQPTQPITVNVTVQNPVVDTPAREQRLVAQMEQIVNGTLRQQLDDVLKGGKNVSRRSAL